MTSKRTFMLTMLLALAVVSTSAWAADPGTSLSVVASSTEASTCNEAGARTVTFDWTAVSTGAADAATVTVSVNGGADTQVGSIASGSAGWTITGRTKTAAGTFGLNLAPGTYSITICVTQHGSDGRTTKKACATLAVVVTPCPETVCPGGDNGARGEIHGNPNAFCGS